MKLKPDTIICGDCIEILNESSENSVDLVFADPPFNIGYKYDKYKDKHKSEKYIAWTEDWMRACCRVLKPAGSFYIAIGDEYAANIKVIADRIGLTLRNWIIWHYTFGQQTKSKFARSHAHIFYFSMDAKEFTFNDYAIRVPSDRQFIYNDKRANSAGKLPDDVWKQFSRVCGTFGERQCWHPCQMPELLLMRIVAASSNESDIVLDPFSGSGTTAAAACMLGRKYAGLEMSENYVELSRERLEDLKKYISNYRHLVFNHREMTEIKRLFIEIGQDGRDLLEKPYAMQIFARQLEIRMNNNKKYDPGQVAVALVEFESYNQKSKKMLKNSV